MPAAKLEPEQQVFVGVNQHYDIETKERSTIADRNNEVMRALNEDWNSFRNYATNAAVKLIGDEASVKETSP